MEIESNTCCVLTPPGAAALAVVRVCGSGGISEFFAKRFSRTLAPSRCVHGELRDGSGDVIDDPVIVLSADSSFADISLHGGPWVLQATLELLQGDGFSICDEPSAKFREIASGLERAVLRALPLATTELGLRCLLAQPEAWKRFGETHRTDPVKIFERVAPANPTPAMLAELSTIRADRALHWLLHPPTIAIVGPANAGKSTLANVLLGQERSIVADLPGTTRDWVGETTDLEGLPVMVIDTPGIREGEDAIETGAIASALRKVQTADLVLLVLDASRPLEPEQQPLIERFPRALRVVNKCDLLPLFDLSACGALRMSAQQQQGVDALVDAIHAHFGVANLDPHRPRLF